MATPRPAVHVVATGGSILGLGPHRLDYILACCILATTRWTSSRHGRLLLGKQIGKDIFRSLSELESFVRIQDQGLHKCLGLLTTRFPNGFDGPAFRQ